MNQYEQTIIENLRSAQENKRLAADASQLHVQQEDAAIKSRIMKACQTTADRFLQCWTDVFLKWRDQIRWLILDASRGGRTTLLLDFYTWSPYGWLDRLRHSLVSHAIGDPNIWTGLDFDLVDECHGIWDATLAQLNERVKKTLQISFLQCEFKALIGYVMEPDDVVLNIDFYQLNISWRDMK